MLSAQDSHKRRVTVCFVALTACHRRQGVHSAASLRIPEPLAENLVRCMSMDLICSCCYPFRVTQPAIATDMPTQNTVDTGAITQKSRKCAQNISHKTKDGYFVGV